MTLCLYGIEDLFHKLPIHWMWWPALGGIAVGIGGYYDPAVLGVGYDNILPPASGGPLHPRRDIASVPEDGCLADRPVVRNVRRRLGAPTDYGRALGMLEGQFIPFADPGFWRCWAWRRYWAATMRAPLTAAFFAMELTGNSHILLPVLAASVAAFGTTVLLMKRSILTERIARRGLHLTRESMASIRFWIPASRTLWPSRWTRLCLDAGRGRRGVLRRPGARAHHKSYPVRGRRRRSLP